MPEYPQRNMIELTTHQVEGAETPVRIFVTDEAGAGGAHHRYRVRHAEPVNEHTPPEIAKARLGCACDIHFQEGAIKEHGVNGITQEVLLAIVEHRLSCFQQGPYPSSYNDLALSHVRAALDALKQRTLDRIERGVEGETKA